MVNIDRHTHPIKRSGRIPVTCAVCHRQYEARRRTARFCGTRCRKVAERRRGEPSKMDVTVNRRPSALAVGTRSPKSAERTSPRRCAASSAADATLNHPVDIVPDAHWPNMWRLAYEDGRLSGVADAYRLDHVTLTPGATALAVATDTLWVPSGRSAHQRAGDRGDRGRANSAMRARV